MTIGKAFGIVLAIVFIGVIVNVLGDGLGSDTLPSDATSNAASSTASAAVAYCDGAPHSGWYRVTPKDNSIAENSNYAAECNIRSAYPGAIALVVLIPLVLVGLLLFAIWSRRRG